MTDLLQDLDELIENGSLKTIHFGRSAVKRRKRFCTLDVSPEGSYRGEGETVAEAIEDAMNNAIVEGFYGEVDEDDGQDLI